jgi:hypothetical protein
MSRADDVRARIATEQESLVNALVKSSPPPGGFDSSALQATATSLVRKRMRAVARTWPVLAEWLGPRLVELFEAYAQSEPLPLGGSLADGRTFVRWLAAQSELPEACWLEAMVVDLRYRTTANGLVLRRWPSFRVVWLPESRRHIIGVWLPVLGQCWLRLPFWTNVAE